jgi:hypothetical protein
VKIYDSVNSDIGKYLALSYKSAALFVDENLKAGKLALRDHHEMSPLQMQ